MKQIFGLSILILAVLACDKTEPVDINELVAGWTVLETGDIVNEDSYEVSIKKDEMRNATILVYNFLNLADDPNTSLSNYALRMRVEGNRLIVDPQQVGSVEVLSGNGIINDNNQFTLNYKVVSEGLSFNGSAMYIRN